MEHDFLKIINATYKLFDFLPDADPLKNKAKERVLLIMEKLAVGDSPASDDVAILESYLELAKAQGWIDGVNFLIIKKELGKFNVVRPKKIESINIEDYSKRQEKIMQILIEKEKIQVQDVLREMPNITKRTIRRDLDDLLKRGKITRTGDFNQVFYQNTDRTR